MHLSFAEHSNKWLVTTQIRSCKCEVMTTQMKGSDHLHNIQIRGGDHSKYIDIRGGEQLQNILMIQKA